MIVKRRPQKVELGKYYVVSFFRRLMVVRFIQPTQKGYNFLNVDTAKCILRHHLYPQKDTTNTFWIGDYLNIISKHSGIVEKNVG